jgi:hypothetical protein
MRKITEESISAFNECRPFKKANMEVTVYNDKTCLWLFGNCIASKDESGDLTISNCGWQTNTTKERLNALNGVSISQKNFVWYLNGKQWDGRQTTIKN